MIGLIGPNGSRKNHVFNTISGLVPSSSGSITFEGSDTTKVKVDQLAPRSSSDISALAALSPTLGLRQYRYGSAGTHLQHGVAQHCAEDLLFTLNFANSRKRLRICSPNSIPAWRRKCLNRLKHSA
ncbi:ATP-binding cassette domain-containing protein [Rhizobium beringeri]